MEPLQTPEQNKNTESTYATTPPEATKSRLKVLPFLRMAALSIGVLGISFFGGWAGYRYGAKNTPPSVQKEQVILEGQSELISGIAETVGESVVSITVKSQGSNFFNSQLEGAGTGIILSEDGLIVTNRHVVPVGTTEVVVTLADGTEYEGVQIVGRTGNSDSLDVAFLRIADTKGKKLIPAKIGDSSKMKVGDTVVAIGNALGQFQNTVTSGIISGHGRSIQASSGDGSETGNLEDLFQTDAAINAGNSGGPLVNIAGEVIGINTAVASGDAQGIGFAIPINDVSGLIKTVQEKGVLERPFIGVIYIPLTNDAAEAYGLSVNRGAYIPPENIIGSQPILPGGPAERAGLRTGDIIIKIDDTPIDQHNSLSAIVNKRAVGDKIKLTILRENKEQIIEVTLGAAPTN